MDLKIRPHDFEPKYREEKLNEVEKNSITDNVLFVKINGATNLTN